MKFELVVWVVAAGVVFSSAAEVPPRSATSPSRGLAVSADGDLVDRETGKPVYLLSTSVNNNIFEDAKYLKVWENSYSKENLPYWLYGRDNAPASLTTFKHIGFNAMNFFSLPTMLQALESGGGDFTAADEAERAREFAARTGIGGSGDGGWKMPSDITLRLHDTLVTNLWNAGYPIYVDLYPGFPSYLQRNADKVSAVTGQDPMFVSPGEKSAAFHQTFRIGDPKVRARMIDLYLAGARHYWNLGVKPFVYKLFNESSYSDGTPANRARFVAETRRRFTDITALNAAWRTDYRSFEELTERGTEAFAIEFKKFQERQVAGLVREVRDALRRVDPDAQVLSQVHSGAWKCNWNNFNQFLINQHTGFVSPGTGAFNFPDGVRCDDSAPFAETDAHLRTMELFARNTFYHALADGKPLLNTESYVGGVGDRFLDFKRLLWGGVAEGVSMQNIWQWAGYWNRRLKVRITYLIHHPNATSPESWSAVKEAQSEIDAVADIFLPRENREKARSAVLFSYPTLRADAAGTGGFTLGCEALRVLNVPVDALLEEQLAGGRQNRYSFISTLGVSRTASGTLESLEQWVRGGGTLLIDAKSLRMDEYGNAVSPALLEGLVFVDGAGGVRETAAGERFLDTRRIVASGGWRTVATADGNVVIASRSFGEGRVLAVAGEWKPYALASFMRSVLRRVGIEGVTEIRRESDGGLAAHITARRFNGGKWTGLLVLNHAESPRLVRVRAPKDAGAAAVESVRRVVFPVVDGWVTLRLAPRSVSPLVFGAADALAERFGAVAVSGADAERAAFESENAAYLATAWTRPGMPVDLRMFANYGFDNQQGWKTPSAWFDAGRTNLVSVPYHAQRWNRTPFEIIRFDYNDNRTCVALRSRNLPEAPERVEGIPLGGQFRGVAFLVGATHTRDGETAMTVRFRYEDGTAAEVPVRVGREVGDWRVAANAPEMARRAVWRDAGGYGFFLWEWNNPRPTERLVSMDLVAGGGETTPIVVAATALPTVFTKRYAHSLRLVDAMRKVTVKSGAKVVRDDGAVETRRERVTFETEDGRAITVTPDELKDGVLRFRIENIPDAFGKFAPLHLYWWGLSLRGG